MHDPDLDPFYRSIHIFDTFLTKDHTIDCCQTPAHLCICKYPKENMLNAVDMQQKQPIQEELH